MKTVWVSVIPWSKELVTSALEAGADGVYVDPGRSSEVKALGLISTIATDGDFILGRDIHEVTITGKADEERVVELSRTAPVIVTTTDWTVIPLENLIAAGARIIARVGSVEEALTAAQTLESGVEGVLLETRNPEEIRRTTSVLKGRGEHLTLQIAEISAIKPLGMGDRVCVDTCTNLHPGQGMLVGNSSAALFLVHAETQDNPYVDPRPFRVNAGAVHAYLRMPGGKTRYLADLRAGDETLVVDSQGHTEPAYIGRVKVERRPLALVTARLGDREITTILQNAETIRLVTPEGTPLSVVEMQPGSQVLVHLEEAGRHFGMKVEETIIER